ncbi:MAG: NADPH-dependent FMN reductase [Patescibacteria group bacterium]
MNIPVILSTARKGRQSEKVAAFVYEKTSFDSEIIDVRDWMKPATKRYPENQKKLQEKFQKADGFIIVSPEYNSGYPGELKILLDTYLDEYKDKPVGIIGVSAGSFGGIRMIEKLRPVLVNLGMVPIRKTVTFKNVNDVFDDEGNLRDDSYNKRVEDFIKALKRRV